MHRRPAGGDALAEMPERQRASLTLDPASKALLDETGFCIPCHPNQKGKSWGRVVSKGRSHETTRHAHAVRRSTEEG